MAHTIGKELQFVSHMVHSMILNQELVIAGFGLNCDSRSARPNGLFNGQLSGVHSHGGVNVR